MRFRMTLLLVALAVPAAAGFGFYASRQSAPALTVQLDNARVTVTESLTPAGGRRESYTRPTDQIIIFIDAAEYESVDAGGKATPRRRQPGEIVWHAKGEVAPVLLNKGKPYRNLIVALK